MQHVEGSYPTHVVFFYRRTLCITPRTGWHSLCYLKWLDESWHATQGHIKLGAHSDLDICLHKEILKGQTALWSSEGSLPPGWLSYLAAISLMADNAQTVSIRGLIEPAFIIINIYACILCKRLRHCPRVLFLYTYFVLGDYFFIIGSVKAIFRFPNIT